MHAHEAIRLNHQLNIIRNPVPRIQGAVRARLIRDDQQLVDGLLVDADSGRELGESRIRRVARLVDDVDVKVRRLLLEQLPAEV